MNEGSGSVKRNALCNKQECWMLMNLQKSGFTVVSQEKLLLIFENNFLLANQASGSGIKVKKSNAKRHLYPLI